MGDIHAKLTWGSLHIDAMLRHYRYHALEAQSFVRSPQVENCSAITKTTVSHPGYVTEGFVVFLMKNAIRDNITLHVTVWKATVERNI